MSKPKILTSAFWTPRIDALTDNVGRAVRGALQAVALAFLGARTDTIAHFDWKLAIGAATTGALLSFATTFAKPPQPPGGDPALDTPVKAADRGNAAVQLLIEVLVVAVLVGLVLIVFKQV